MRTMYASGLIALSALLGAEDFENTPKINVRGEASVLQPSDTMSVSLGVATSGATSAEALAENNKKMEQVIDNLKALGLDTSDYQTGQFQIDPVRQKEVKEGPGKIVRYDVLNAIQVKTKKIDLANKIIATAVKGGANQIEHVNFSLNSPEAYRATAIQQATKNALNDGKALAEALGVKIKKVLNASIEEMHPFARQGFSLKSMGTNDAGESDALTPGTTEIKEAVNLVLEIEAPNY